MFVAGKTVATAAEAGGLSPAAQRPAASATVAIFLPAKNIGLLLVSSVRSRHLSHPRLAILLPSEDTGYQSVPGRHVPRRARLIPSAASHPPRADARPERRDAAGQDPGSTMMIVEWSGLAIAQTAES